METIIKAINQAGGYTAVSKQVGKSPAAVHQWGVNGIPRTDYTGETSYTKTLEKMQRRNGFRGDDLVSRKILLSLRLA